MIQMYRLNVSYSSEPQYVNKYDIIPPPQGKDEGGVLPVGIYDTSNGQLSSGFDIRVLCVMRMPHYTLRKTFNGLLSSDRWWTFARQQYKFYFEPYPL